MIERSFVDVSFTIMEGNHQLDQAIPEEMKAEKFIKKINSNFGNSALSADPSNEQHLNDRMSEYFQEKERHRSHTMSIKVG